MIVNSCPLRGSAQGFSVRDDVAPRIGLDGTLISTDSQVGDPLSATVVDEGEYQNARVLGHIAQIDISGRVKGRTRMVLRMTEDHAQQRPGNADPFYVTLKLSDQ